MTKTKMSSSQLKRRTMLKMITMTRMPRLRLKSRDSSRLNKRLNRKKRNKPPKSRQRSKSLKMSKNNATKIKPRKLKKTRRRLIKTRRRLKVPIRWRIPRQPHQLKTRMTMLS